MWIQQNCEKCEKTNNNSQPNTAEKINQKTRSFELQCFVAVQMFPAWVWCPHQCGTSSVQDYHRNRNISRESLRGLSFLGNKTISDRLDSEVCRFLNCVVGHHKVTGRPPNLPKNATTLWRIKSKTIEPKFFMLSRMSKGNFIEKLVRICNLPFKTQKSLLLEFLTPFFWILLWFHHFKFTHLFQVVRLVWKRFRKKMKKIQL